jgi:dipeptidyl aminopeptidase/acylaminoacyl peptidase
MRSWAVVLALVFLFLAACQTPAHAGDPGPSMTPDIETFMQIGAASNPMLTRDGSVLLFTTSQTGTRQLYRLTPEGWPYQLTFFPSGMSSYNLSRDERRIGVTAALGGNEEYQIYTCDPMTGLTSRVTDQPGARFGIPIFSPDGSKMYFSGNADSVADFYIYEQDVLVSAAKSRRILWGPKGQNGLLDMSEDGRWLLISHATSNANNDLYALEVGSGRAQLVTPHDGDVLYSAAVFSREAHKIYVITDQNPDGIPRLAIIDWGKDPSRISFLFPEDRSPWANEELTISPDRGVLAWTLNEDGWGRLRLWDIGTNRSLPVPGADGIYSNPTLSETGSVAFVMNSPLQTADVWTWDWTERRLEQRTFSSYAGIDPAWFTPPTLVHYASFDGASVPAFLYLPKGYRDGDGPIPFIIDVHGGPEAQFRPYFNRHFQFLLLHGYGIFAPNVRGSTGYGRAWQEADNYKKRLDSVRDVAQGAEYLINRKLTTPSRIGIKGASYGGYMVLAAMTEYPDLFAAGIDEVGISDFQTYFAGTAAYRRDMRASEYGPPGDVEFLRSISPIHKIDRLKGALMVVHGENDPRVPVREARQILAALAARNAPVDSLIFPDEGHVVAKLPNRLVLYRRMVDFFDRHLKSSR